MMANKNLQLFTFCLVALICATFTSGRKGFGPGEQDWGHVEVRHGAKMFYWLYYTTAPVKNYTERPLVIWLQGGPGASSTGYGNFEELGPLDLNLEYRNYTWVKDVNVVFIDNPVGTGFSYVESTRYLTTNNTQIALDLVAFMKVFYRLHPQFRKVPLHIFSESYGGKMAAEFALELYKARKANQIETNLKSVSLGNSWISPVDSVNSWAPLLLDMGIIDYEGHNEIVKAAKRVDDAVKSGRFWEATSLWGQCQRVLLKRSENVDFYNILKPIGKYLLQNYNAPRDLMYQTLVRYESRLARSLDGLMQGQVSKALNIPKNVVWGSQSNAVFNALSVDFMKPVIHIVEKLLETTDLDVVVYTGQLDLICATPGTINWIEKMNWKSKSQFKSSPRVSFAPKGMIEGFVKQTGRFYVYWMNRAGHMVPTDNPVAMAHVLKQVTKHD